MATKRYCTIFWSFWIDSNILGKWQSRVAGTSIYKTNWVLGYFPFDIDTSTNGGTIKEYRYKHGLSHKAFGKVIKINATTIGSWENDECVPRKQYLKELQQLFNK